MILILQLFPSLFLSHTHVLQWNHSFDRFDISRIVMSRLSIDRSERWDASRHLQSRVYISLRVSRDCYLLIVTLSKIFPARKVIASVCHKVRHNALNIMCNPYCNFDHPLFYIRKSAVSYISSFLVEMQCARRNEYTITARYVHIFVSTINIVNDKELMPI